MSHLRLHFALFIFHLKGCVILAVIPPAGTSAHKAFERSVSISHVRSGDGFSASGGKFPEKKTGIDRLKTPGPSKLNDVIDESKDALDAKPDPKRKRIPSPSDPSGGSSHHHTSAKKALKYYEAPLAEYYGFNKATAYQEALSNTAYRREMADMRKAGLNPSVIYGSHNSSGADSGIFPREDSGFGGYGGAGGSGGSGRRYRGSNSGKHVFSGGAYYGTMAVVGTIVAAATKNVGAGMAAAGLAGTAMKAINGFLKK